MRGIPLHLPASFLPVFLKLQLNWKSEGGPREGKGLTRRHLESKLKPKLTLWALKGYWMNGGKPVQIFLKPGKQ